MNPFRALGFLVLLVGVILQPIGWMYSHWLTPIAFIAIFAGVFFLLRGRQLAGGESSIDRVTGREMPGDIHGYSGQMSGGRSTSWESSHSVDSDGSDGGGGGD
jgi:hypothetical protein